MVPGTRSACPAPRDLVVGDLSYVALTSGVTKDGLRDRSYERPAYADRSPKTGTAAVSGRGDRPVRAPGRDPTGPGRTGPDPGPTDPGRTGPDPGPTDPGRTGPDPGPTDPGRTGRDPGP